MPRISAEKLNRLKKSAGRGGRAVVRGGRATALQLVAGVAAGLVQSVAAQKVSFMGDNWWATPAMIALGGIMARRSKRLVGVSDALLGVAGFAGYQGFQASRIAASVPAADRPDTGLVIGQHAWDAPHLIAPSVRVPMTPAASTEPNDTEDTVSSSIDTMGLN